MSLNYNVEQLVRKIRICPDFGILFALKESFNSVGLALRETLGHRMVLCRVANGYPVTIEMVEDYIFIGYADQQRLAISDNIEECIVQFVETNASNNKLTNNKYNMAGHKALYGDTVRIRDEDIKETLQGAAIAETKRDTSPEDDLLESLKKWLENTNAEL